MRQAIELDLQELGLGSAKGPTKKAGAVLRSRYHYRSIDRQNNRGKWTKATTSLLIVKNDGDTTAEKVKLLVDEPDGEAAGYRWGSTAPDKPFDLLPGAEREWPFVPLGSMREATIRTIVDRGGKGTFARTNDIPQPVGLASSASKRFDLADPRSGHLRNAVGTLREITASEGQGRSASVRQNEARWPTSQGASPPARGNPAGQPLPS